MSSLKNRFVVTDMIGFCFNAVTGDFSRGASGWWIEDGKLAFPVEEVTIAGNFRDMLRGIEMIGDDLRYRGRLRSEEHTSELQSLRHLVCRLLLEKKNKTQS